MTKQRGMSRQTRINWVIDAAVFFSAVAAILTGIYFLFLPNGSQGGRNSLYATTLLFERNTWNDIHTWGGALMILAVVIHFSYHWTWVKTMARRVAKSMRGQGTHMSSGARLNLIVDAIIGLSFLITAISGLYFLFVPTGGYQGGRNPGWDTTTFLFSRTTWDLIHTWAGVLMIAAALVHIAIHWRWITKVTTRFFVSLWQRPARQATPTTPSTITRTAR